MARLTPDGNVVRVVDFHTNCSCGRDVHIVGDAVRVGDTSVVDLTVSAAAAQIVSHDMYLELVAADDDEAVNDEAEATEVDDLEAVATPTPAAAPAAQPRRGRPPRAGGGG